MPEYSTDYISSIAILPFRNLSSNQENEYFCDGITEEIINALAGIDHLKVTSRTSSFYFKNHQLPLAEIANKLSADILLEGSVRISDGTIRIQAQLIDIEEDTQFWSETWDRQLENLFAIQDEISLLIADKIRENKGHLGLSDHLLKSPTQNLTAYEHLLKGQYHFYKWNPTDINLAIQEFEKSLELDAKLIDAHLGLADSYSFMAVAGFSPREESWALATDFIRKAMELDPNNARLNLMLSNQAFFTEANFSAAMNYAQKSIAVRPTYAEGHQFLSFYHTLKGDFKKAKEHILYAKSVDPLNPETRFFEASYFYRTHEFEKALVILNELLAENTRNLPALVVLAYIYLHQRKINEAKALIEQMPVEVFTPEERLGILTLIDLLSEEKDSKNFKELEKYAEDPEAHHAHSYLYLAYVNLGQFDKAFEVANKIVELNSSVLLIGFSDPLASDIKSDARYAELHSRIYESQELSSTKKTKKKAPDEAVARKQVEKLQLYIEANSPFLNPSLSLRSLADQVDIHPNQLSWLLNEFIGKNFNEFVNHKRIAYFKKLIVDPANSHISIIGLAYESGFNSKTVFNTAFKKATGLTPKEYQKNHC
ncbi:MAG: helix-turn-helix domain-containing protein [Ekhidna sp.]|nr:helix-turn-helix domain-containing protein [Ekhidna sp.]